MYSVSNQLSSVCTSQETFWKALEKHIVEKQATKEKKEGAKAHLIQRYCDQHDDLMIVGKETGVTFHHYDIPSKGKGCEFTDHVKAVAEIYRLALHQAMQQSLETCEMTFIKQQDKYHLINENKKEATLSSYVQWTFVNPLFTKFLSSIEVNSILESNPSANTQTIKLSIPRQAPSEIPTARISPHEINCNSEIPTARISPHETYSEMSTVRLSYPSSSDYDILYPEEKTTGIISPTLTSSLSFTSLALRWNVGEGYRLGMRYEGDGRVWSEAYGKLFSYDETREEWNVELPVNTDFKFIRVKIISSEKTKRSDIQWEEGYNRRIMLNSNGKIDSSRSNLSEPKW